MVQMVWKPVRVDKKIWVNESRKLVLLILKLVTVLYKQTANVIIAGQKATTP